MILSIVVPIYNVEKYLGECLDSLVSQDIGADQYEILCINDGSTDQSGTILDDYAKRYPQIHAIHQENAGVSSARNIGIELAKGDYIWFVDSDDFIVHNSLGNIMQILKNAKPDILMVNPIQFKDGIDTIPYREGKIKKDQTSQQYHDWLWTRLIKRSIILESKVRFHPAVSLAEDHLFCTMLNPFVAEIMRYDAVVYCYRHRENALSTTPTENKIEKLICSAETFLQQGQNQAIRLDTAMNMVCFFVVPITSHIAQLPRNQAQPILNKLKEKNLFPLKKQTSYHPDLSSQTSSLVNRLLTKLKHISYTRSGYLLLRGFRLLLKIKRKLFRLK